jgi:hypothetical protein
MHYLVAALQVYTVAVMPYAASTYIMDMGCDNVKLLHIENRNLWTTDQISMP